MTAIPRSVYLFINSMARIAPFYRMLSTMETQSIERQVCEKTIRKPVYICGLARAGTTVTLDLLARHPDMASHSNYHYAQPFIPYWLDRVYPLLPLGKDKPFERVHKDKLMTTRKSPDVVEEIFWDTFFEHLHKENQCNVLKTDASNPAFEKFYTDHIRKLMISRQANRYLTKNNYIFSRAEYLSKILPDALFILLIRNPVHHIASYLKQDALFSELAIRDSRWPRYLKGIGHYEFGPARTLINVGNTEQTQSLSDMWKDGQRVRACAMYWNMIYMHIHERIICNRSFKDRFLCVRYEDLCNRSSTVMDELIRFCELDPAPFQETKKDFEKRLSMPTYYQPKFSEQERQSIKALTRPAAEAFGLNTA